MSEPNSPEIAAGMYDPVFGGSLPQSFLHQRVAISEQLHRQLVLGGFEQSHQHAAHRPRTRRLLSLSRIISVDVRFQPVVAALHLFTFAPLRNPLAWIKSSCDGTMVGHDGIQHHR